MYIYVKLNHFTIQQKLAQYCKSTIFQLKTTTTKTICKESGRYMFFEELETQSLEKVHLIPL